MSEDWSIEETEDGESLRFSWKNEEAKKNLLYYIGEVGGLSAEEIDEIVKRIGKDDDDRTRECKDSQKD